MNDITTVIADDHVVVRIGLRLLLEVQGGFTVVGEAVDAAGVIDLCSRLDPDLVIIDLQMAGRADDGLRGITALRSDHPRTRILVLSQHADDETLFAVLRAGAHGFCAKHDVQESLIRAAATVAAGDVYFGAAVAEQALGLITAQHAVRVPLPELTARQRNVLELMAAGVGDTGIGRQLGISRKTVQNHVTAIARQLNVADRTEAVARARAAGLGISPAPR